MKSDSLEKLIQKNYEEAFNDKALASPQVCQIDINTQSVNTDSSVKEKPLIQLSANDMRKMEQLRQQLDMAMRGKDIQEIAEVVYDIKDLKFHKEGMIDISEAERMIFESD